MTRQVILVGIIHEVRSTVKSAAFGNLGRSLNRITRSDAAPDVIIAWLRSSYAARSKIPRYWDYVDQARETLTEYRELAPMLFDGLVRAK